MGTESRPRTERPRIVCHHCQRPEHKRPDCPDLPPRQGSDHHTTGSGRPSTDNRGRWTPAAPPASTVQTIGQTLCLPTRSYRESQIQGVAGFRLGSHALTCQSCSGIYLATNISCSASRKRDGNQRFGSPAYRHQSREMLRLDTEFIVSDQIEEILLGMDWMDRHQCILECGSKILTIQRCSI